MSTQAKAHHGAVHVSKAANQMTQAGMKLKSVGGSLEIDFQEEFATPPVVVISPFYQGSAIAVEVIETITSVGTTSFVVTSLNGASNYFVNWIAIGRAL
ncbi:MAG TPA: H-type lectin domain-containing protein [Candidatus Angelobacter sp.]|nr:H-type lectin domain-containing protein [Candidatus Angelobacter sp.]